MNLLLLGTYQEKFQDVFYFLQEDGSITGFVADIHNPVSPIPEGGLEILILMHFVHRKKKKKSKMKDFIKKQLDFITQLFEFNQGNTTDSEEETLEIEVGSDTEATEGHPENIAADDGVPDVILID